MNRIKYVKTTAIFLAFLIVMFPICFADTLNLIYDKRGNLISGDGYYRKYNSLNQLWKVYNGTSDSDPLLEEYTYHPVEERVLIKNVTNNDGSWKETVYYVSKDFVRVVNTTGTFDTTYIYHEGQLVAERDNSGTETFYHPDHLGSTTLITDSGGSSVETSSYTPFGVILTGGEESRYDYTGQEYDDVVEDYDYHARRYKAEWGKLISPDTLLSRVYFPQNLNRYSYAYNNPYKYTDPDGHEVNVVQESSGWMIYEDYNTEPSGYVYGDEVSWVGWENDYPEGYQGSLYKKTYYDYSAKIYTDEGEKDMMLSDFISSNQRKTLKKENIQDAIYSAKGIASVLEDAYTSTGPGAVGKVLLGYKNLIFSIKSYVSGDNIGAVLNLGGLIAPTATINYIRTGPPEKSGMKVNEPIEGYVVGKNEVRDFSRTWKPRWMRSRSRSRGRSSSSTSSSS